MINEEVISQQDAVPHDEPVLDQNTGFHRFHLSLGHHTVVSILAMGEVVDRPRGGGNIVLDYEFVERGKMSVLGVKKRLQRFFLNTLIVKVYDDQSAPVRHRRRVARARQWNSRHIDCFPSPES